MFSHFPKHFLKFQNNSGPHTLRVCHCCCSQYVACSYFVRSCHSIPLKEFRLALGRSSMVRLICLAGPFFRPRGPFYKAEEERAITALPIFREGRRKRGRGHVRENVKGGRRFTKEKKQRKKLDLSIVGKLRSRHKNNNYPKIQVIVYLVLPVLCFTSFCGRETYS